MLTPDERQILERAKFANEYWFKAVIEAAEIMVERRAKYAGSDHPYYNFVDMSYRNGEDILKVFRNYINIKASRLSKSLNVDFSDERVVDTFMDLGNYGMLAAGWILGQLNSNDVVNFDEWYDTYLKDIEEE